LSIAEFEPGWHPRLSRLVLHGYKWQSRDVTEGNLVTGAYRTLRHIGFISNQIENLEFESLFSVLKKFFNLRSLELRKSRFTVAHFEHLMEQLQEGHLANIESIEFGLDFSCISQRQLESLHSRIKETPFKVTLTQEDA